MIDRNIRFLVIFSTCLLSLNSWGWGQLGHRTVGLIAQSRLSSQSQTAIKELLGNSTLADVSIWADSARPQAPWKHTSGYHYNDAPDGLNLLATLKQMDAKQRAKGGAIQALLVAEAVLRNPATSDADKKYAVQFLVHFVGDIHQPLHVGRPEDRGGNDIKLRWDGVDVNLHSVWDTMLIQYGHDDILNGKTPQEQSKIYAAYLTKNLVKVSPPQGTAAHFEAWFNESIVPRKSIYEDRDLSNQDYTQQFIDTADQRIYFAGLRLADLFNRIFGNQAPSNPSVQLRKNIEAIVGKLEDIIQLTPASLTTN